MERDEQEIRQLVSTWLEACKTTKADVKQGPITTESEA